MGTVVILSKGTELLRFQPERLMYIESDGNYSYVVTQDGRRTMVSFQLGQIEEELDRQLGPVRTGIVRLGRGLIINCNFVFQIDTARQKLVLSDCMGSSYELSASRVVLIKLKSFIENRHE